MVRLTNFVKATIHTVFGVKPATIMVMKHLKRLPVSSFLALFFALLVFSAVGICEESKDLPPVVSLGVMLSDLNSEIEKRLSLTDTFGIGALVVEVYKGSSAELAGIKVDDVIVEYAGHNVVNTKSFIDMVRTSARGSSVEVQIIRNSKKQAFTIQYGSSPMEVSMAWIIVGKQMWAEGKEDEALNAFKRSVASAPNNSSALVGLGYAYSSLKVGKDDVQAIKCWRKAAEQGNADGQLYLGWMYANGTGIDKDQVEAVKWYRKAAEQGNADAQSNLGVMYANGTGIDKDQVEAVKWYRKAAEQGNADAQCNLGWICQNSTGVTKNFVEAVKWYRKAAEQNNANAQYNLGLMYANGQGVDKDVTEAVKWYRKAAEQGNADAQSNLGVMYANGTGVTKDESEAMKWYRKALDSNPKYARAWNNLSIAYDALGQHDDALIAYNKAVELDPSYRKTPPAERPSETETRVARPTQSDKDLQDLVGTIFGLAIQGNIEEKIRNDSEQRLRQYGGQKLVCPRCGGVGRIESSDGLWNPQCQTCGGTGFIIPGGR